MRFYVFTPGRPGYIAAEVAVRELTDEHEARAWASDTWSPATTYDDERRFVSRAEALMVPLYREALERWEARDDSVLQATEVAEIRASSRSTAAHDAELGCSVSAAALEADDDEAIHAVISEHVHEGCGGRDFPDEPKSRALQVAQSPVAPKSRMLWTRRPRRDPAPGLTARTSGSRSR